MRNLANYSFCAEPSEALFDGCTTRLTAWLVGKGVGPDAAGAVSREVPVLLGDGKSATLIREAFASPAGRTASLRLTETADDGNPFTTIIEFASTADAVRTFVRLQAGVTEFGRRSDPDPHLPRVLREVLAASDWRYQSTPIVTRPYQFVGQADGHDQLAELVLSPARGLPVVVVSIDPDFPLPDRLPSDLAKAVTGLGVVATADPDASWGLTDRLGAEWSCFRGGLRLYWPRVDVAGGRYLEHPLWTWSRLADTAADPARLAVRLVRQVKRLVMEQSVSAIRRPSVFDSLREAAVRAEYEQKLKSAQTKRELSELAELYALDNDKLRREVVRLKTEVDRLDTELAELRRRQAVPAADLPPDADVPPSTPVEAVERAKARFGKVLAFGADVLTGAEQLADRAGPPEKILEHLRVLAVMSEKWKAGALGTKPILWLRAQQVNASGESETVRNSRRERQKRTWDFGDKTTKFFEHHTKPNDSTTADNCVRIYFRWCESRNLLVIGWVGPHPN